LDSAQKGCGERKSPVGSTFFIFWNPHFSVWTSHFGWTPRLNYTMLYTYDDGFSATVPSYLRVKRWPLQYNNSNKSLEAKGSEGNGQNPPDKTTEKIPQPMFLNVCLHGDFVREDFVLQHFRRDSEILLGGFCAGLLSWILIRRDPFFLHFVSDTLVFTSAGLWLLQSLFYY